MAGSGQRLLTWVLAAVASSFVALGLAACGGEGSSSGVVVARVGGSVITRAAVSHWMATLAGGDYFELSGQHTVPAGLVSDPPDYPRCIASLEATAAKSPVKNSKLTGAQLLTKCQELYEALKLQAAALLVKAQWIIGMSREVGATATDGEALQILRRFMVKQFPSEARYRRDLASRRESVSDELLLLKVNLLVSKLQQKASREGKQLSAMTTEAERRWNAKTNCSSGYVVQHCKQYTGGSYPSQGPAVLMEQVAKIATGRCVNLPACGKQ